MSSKIVTPERKAAGERLELLRGVLGFPTKIAFAEYLGVGEDTYRHWAEGRHNIPRSICALLKERKGVPTEWLPFGDRSQLPRSLERQLYPEETA